MPLCPSLKPTDSTQTGHWWVCKATQPTTAKNKDCLKIMPGRALPRTRVGAAQLPLSLGIHCQLSPPSARRMRSVAASSLTAKPCFTKRPSSSASLRRCANWLVLPTNQPSLGPRKVGWSGRPTNRRITQQTQNPNLQGERWSSTACQSRSLPHAPRPELPSSNGPISSRPACRAAPEGRPTDSWVTRTPQLHPHARGQEILEAIASHLCNLHGELPLKDGHQTSGCERYSHCSHQRQHAHPRRARPPSLTAALGAAAISLQLLGRSLLGGGTLGSNLSSAALCAAALPGAAFPAAVCSAAARSSAALCSATLARSCSHCCHILSRSHLARR